MLLCCCFFFFFLICNLCNASRVSPERTRCSCYQSLLTAAAKPVLITVSSSVLCVFLGFQPEGPPALFFFIFLRVCFFSFFCSCFVFSTSTEGKLCCETPQPPPHFSLPSVTSVLFGSSPPLSPHPPTPLARFEYILAAGVYHMLGFRFRRWFLKRWGEPHTRICRDKASVTAAASSRHSCSEHSCPPLWKGPDMMWAHLD